ncbi:hypothetical protein AMS68_003818 [Peltaster fructicola]|uniref:Uncharacterized protein n=1 Tax=Peltaster fructicola TaxID=286661 RepID=A0A6H0XUF9_9PEZI|nr:hypothetical protein AMS68_003818 [Peltaster fructicola]
MATKRAGRPAKHDWSDKRDLCYKLYVDEHKQIKEIIDYFTTALGVDVSEVPSRQFRRWQFPSRREKLSSEDEDRLVERIKQLWQANYVQKQMLETLADEGWQLDQPALARLRRKHGVMLRIAAGYNRDNMGPGTGKKRKRDAEEDQQQQEQDVVAELTPAEPITYDAAVQIDMEPADAARRAQRLMEIQSNSDAQFSTRKRRRRIRGYAHLPADAPGLPPRYKSETSLDECKAFLGLSNDLYKELRQKFEDICNDMDIIKKRLCSDGAWESAKKRLIRENVHLSAVLNPVHDNLAERENALEVVCADVTKRMRNMKKRIFVKQANNILGINPEQSKELRRQFYEILRADHFETMLLCGKDHWEELKQQFYDTSDIMQQLLSQGFDEEKKRCVDVLLRDAMKRHNDNNVTKIPHLSQKNVPYGPGPGPAKRGKNEPDGDPVQPSVVLTSYPSARSGRPLDLDPALFAALSADLTINTDPIPIANIAMSDTQAMPLQHFSNVPPTISVTGLSHQTVPAYFRLSTESRMRQQHPKMWLATLQSPTVGALRAAATAKTKTAGIVHISGVVKNDDDGREDQYRIDGDDELAAYLETVKESANGKVTFVVRLDADLAG